MNKMRIFLLVILLGACTQVDSTKPHSHNPYNIPPEGIGLNDIFLLPEKDIPGIKEQALLGSMQADAKIFQYYEMTTDDRDQTIYWAEIGTEICQCSAGMAYMASLNEHYKHDIVNLTRAKFWAEQAIKHGNKDTQYTLKMINEDLKKPEIRVQHISLLERKALLGSAQSALKLANNYKAKNNLTQELYWTRIAVQNGDYNATHKLALLLQNDKDPQNQQRAKYWLGVEQKGHRK